MKHPSVNFSMIIATVGAVALVFFWSVPARAAICPVEDPARGIRCLGNNTICGNTCRLEPTCPISPDTQKAKLDCGGCACQCPDTRPVDCLGANGLCQAHNGTCAGQHREEVCDSSGGATTMRCGNCISGYQDCDGTCQSNAADFCKFPNTWNACAQTCDWAFLLTNYPSVPAGATVPQNSRLQTSGDNQLLNGDVFLSTGRAIRVDQVGTKSKLDIGNLVAGNDGIAVHIFGNTVTDGLTVLQYPTGVEPTLAPPNTILTNSLCLTDGTACRSDWPVGLPIGSSVNLGDTLHYGAAGWIADSALYNNGSRIGLFTNDPWYPLDLESGADTAIFDIYDKSTGGDLWTGLRLTRGADKWNDEKWFIGMPPSDFNLVIANNKAGAPGAISVSNATGHVGIGWENSSSTRLWVAGATGGAIYAKGEGDTTAVHADSPVGLGLKAETQSGTALLAQVNGTGDGIVSQTNAGGAPLVLNQSGSLVGAVSNPVLTASRSHGLNGHDNTAPVLSLSDSSGSSGDLISAGTVSAPAALTLNRAGNLGLGTATPAKNLDVVGSVGGVIARLTDLNGGLWTGLSLSRSGAEKWFVGLGATNDKLLLRRGGSNNDFVIDTNGQVGIGNETPAEKLDVAGKIKMTGFQLLTGAQANYILTSDAQGNGTWGVKPTGLPIGAGVQAGDTLRYDGSQWVANNNLYNDGSKIGIGTSAPQSVLHVSSSTGAEVKIAGTLNSSTPQLSFVNSANSNAAYVQFRDAASSPSNLLRIGTNVAGGQVAFLSGSSSEAVRIDAGGKVGIGTMSPLAQLSIYNSTSNAVELLTLQSAYGINNQKSLTWRDSANIVGQIDTRYDGTSVSMVFGHLYNSGYQTGDLVTIKGTGNVGIGTTVPIKNLDVAAATSGVITRLNDLAGAGSELWTGQVLARAGNEKWFIGLKGTGAPNSPGDKLFLRASQSDANEVVIDQGGNVGIGLTNDAPAQKLDVGGTAQMTGFKMPNGASDKYVLTTDASGVGTWRNMQFADECFGGKFNKFSDAAGNGNQGGYAGANAVCGAANLHVCTPDEIFRTIHCTPALLAGLTDPAWIANGPPGFTSPAANDCVGFTSSAGGASGATYGAFWQFGGVSGGAGYATTCDNVMKFACCSL